MSAVLKTWTAKTFKKYYKLKIPTKQNTHIHRKGFGHLQRQVKGRDFTSQKVGGFHAHKEKSANIWGKKFILN